MAEDKQKLIESDKRRCELDHCNSLPVDDIRQTRDVERLRVEKTVHRCGSVVQFLVFVTLLTSILIAAAFMCRMMLDSRYTDEAMKKFRTSFRGGSGHMINQEVVSSGINNIIEYYVTISSEERVNIIDDFNQDVQIMKISTPFGEICYISKMKKKTYIRPADVIFGTAVNKGYVSQVYETDERPLTDLDVLGVKGRELCKNIPVYWIYPIGETDSHILATSNFTTSSDSSSEIRSRSKRNIPQCRTSCCWQVCCCDINHFTWERAEHFTCNHICNKCTSTYKSVVRKLC